jgi:flagellar hook-basal body complex protein FliE
MSMKIAEALSAYANAAKGGAGLAPRDGSGSGFADLVRQAAQDSVATLQKAEGATLQAAVGKADIGEVVTAVANAEATLQTVAALRDRVVAAYQEIIRMPI